jgi:hypothetical protein
VRPDETEMVGSEGSGQLRTDRPSTYVLNSETLLTVLLMRASPHHQLERRAGAITLPAKSPVKPRRQVLFLRGNTKRLPSNLRLRVCGSSRSATPPRSRCECFPRTGMERSITGRRRGVMCLRILEKNAAVSRNGRERRNSVTSLTGFQEGRRGLLTQRVTKPSRRS